MSASAGRAVWPLPGRRRGPSCGAPASCPRRPAAPCAEPVGWPWRWRARGRPAPVAQASVRTGARQVCAAGDPGTGRVAGQPFRRTRHVESSNRCIGRCWRRSIRSSHPDIPGTIITSWTRHSVATGRAAVHAALPQATEWRRHVRGRRRRCQASKPGEPRAVRPGDAEDGRRHGRLPPVLDLRLLPPARYTRTQAYRITAVGAPAPGPSAVRSSPGSIPRTASPARPRPCRCRPARRPPSPGRG